jgi:hypothetical protein
MNIQTKHNIGDTVAFISNNNIVEDIIDHFYINLENGPTYGIGGAYAIPVDKVFDSKVEAAHHWLTSNGIEIDSKVHNIKCKISTILKEMENTQCQKH